MHVGGFAVGASLLGEEWKLTSNDDQYDLIGAAQIFKSSLE